MEDSSLESQAMEVARKLAEKRFRLDPDREAKVQDAISVAWEFAQNPPESALATTIAWYAIKRVIADRQFRQSIRSIDSHKLQDRRTKAQRPRLEVEWEAFTAPGDNPADIACFWLTFPEWLKTLSRRNREIALAFILGDRTQAVSEKFKISAARVSQLRRELQEDWEVFTA